MKRIVLRIRWRMGAWRVTYCAERFSTQAAAVMNAARAARLRWESGELAQVVLHGKNGRIRWERTYGADPRRTQG